MKVALATKENSLSSGLSEIFARSKYFLIYDDQKDAVYFIENQHYNKEDCIGRDIIDILKEHGTEKIIAYQIGLKVQKKAAKHNIQLIIIPERYKSIKEILKLINKNQYE